MGFVYADPEPPVVADFKTRLFKNNMRTWGTEHNVQQHVVHVLEEVIQYLPELKLSVVSELQLSETNVPDVCVLLQNGVPICIIKVRCPSSFPPATPLPTVAEDADTRSGGTSAQQQRRPRPRVPEPSSLLLDTGVQLQMLDYLLTLEYENGYSCFGIITTYREWCVCWRPELDALALQPPLKMNEILANRHLGDLDRIAVAAALLPLKSTGVTATTSPLSYTAAASASATAAAASASTTAASTATAAPKAAKAAMRHSPPAARAARAKTKRQERNNRCRARN